NVLQQVHILRGKHAIDFVVGGHYRTNTGVVHGSLEGRQIDFAQGALVNVSADNLALLLLVIRGVVLHLSEDTLALNAANFRGGDLRGQVWIFAERFEITPTFGNTDDVDHRTQEDVLPFGFGFGAKSCAVLLGQSPIPRGGERHGRRKRRSGTMPDAGWA